MLDNIETISCVGADNYSYKHIWFHYTLDHCPTFQQAIDGSLRPYKNRFLVSLGAHETKESCGAFVDIPVESAREKWTARCSSKQCMRCIQLRINGFIFKVLFVLHGGMRSIYNRWTIKVSNATKHVAQQELCKRNFFFLETFLPEMEGIFEPCIEFLCLAGQPCADWFGFDKLVNIFWYRRAACNHMIEYLPEILFGELLELKMISN